MRKEVPYSQVLKKFEKEQPEQIEVDHLVMGVEDIERQLLLEPEHVPIKESFPIPDDSEIQISDCVSHETVDSRGEKIKVMIKKELASLIDIQKHM